jgi:hypothetical protein
MIAMPLFVGGDYSNIVSSNWNIFKLTRFNIAGNYFIIYAKVKFIVCLAFPVCI